MLLYSGNGFNNIDFNLHQVTITKTIPAVVNSKLYVHKQKTLYKRAIDGINITEYPDTAIGMTNLKQEVEFGNTGLTIVTNPRYITHTDNRQGKWHSSIIIALTNRGRYNKNT